ncbi:MAG: cytochrome c [Desulfuromonadales bacterium]|nr:cytochrome c [Desulfuromonadales bacterium]
MKRTLVAIEILLIVLIVGFLVFIYSGVYNIAATTTHYSFLEWVVETTKKNSVRRHAKSIAAPPLAGLDLQQGLRHFDAMCVICHGAPGLPSSAIGQGMVPTPPELSQRVRGWTPGEMFWIISNGIKMTGMPAFGPTHSEPELWAILAFVRELPGIAPEGYQALRAKIRPGEMPQPDHH